MTDEVALKLIRSAFDILATVDDEMHMDVLADCVVALERAFKFDD